MSTRAWIVGVAAGLLVAASHWTTSAQDQSTVDKLKAKASETVTSIKKGAANAGEAIKEKFAKTKDAVRGMSIEGRVYARLHWEKALVGSKIDLASPKAGVIALNGTVGDAKAKLKAFELTRDTVGVDEVQDHLTIVAATSTSPGSPGLSKP
jgi:osmotically-inducible protein OsmY